MIMAFLVRVVRRCCLPIGMCGFVACLFVASAARVGATTVVPPDFSAMVNGSDYVVHAVVRSVEAQKRVRAGAPKIFTRVELEVIEVVAGKPPAKIVLELLGGRVGDEELTVDGMPRFAVGDEDILFVSGNGRAICPLYAMMHGRFPIVATSDGRRVVARSSGVPLLATAEIGMPLPEPHRAEAWRDTGGAAGGLSPGEFIQQIRATVTPEAKLHRAH